MGTEKLRVLLDEKTLNRITNVNDHEVRVDVHGMTKIQQQHLLRTISAVYGKVRITVIHGYNHGTSLKMALRDPDILKSSFKMIPHKRNEGVTILDVA